VPARRLGALEVSALGLGCMGMSEFYGPADPAEARATVRRALDLGVTLIDTADSYGIGANERLVGEALRGRREEAVIATKFGIVRGPDGSFAGLDGRPEYVHEACRASLRRLGVERIDLYYCHRLDARVPVEETVGAMAELVAQGLVAHLGLSEARPQDIRRAVAVHPIAALQSEYSLWARDVEDEVLPLLRELGIGLVAFAPLGRGMLAGPVAHADALPDDDLRRTIPRFRGGAHARNRALVERAAELAAARGVSLGQLSLAWLLSRGLGIVPIPGTKRRAYLEENAAAAGIELTRDELGALDETFGPGAVSGGRRPEVASAIDAGTAAEHGGPAEAPPA